MDKRININQVQADFARPTDFKEIVLLLDEITMSIRKSGPNWSDYKIEAQSNDQKKIFKKILEGNGKIFVVRYRGQVVGVINVQIIFNIRHGWRKAHLEECVVKEEFRRMGIGSLMIKKINGYCRKNGIKIVKLLCGNQLKEAHQFYEKNNFKFTDRGYRLKIKGKN